MGSPALARDQLRRLFKILLAVRSHQAPSAQTLADFCEVSRRTIYRDLALLGQVGVPIRYSVEAQGYLLAPEFRFEVPRLEEAEVMALVILAQACDGLEALGMRDEARSAIRKILVGLPDTARGRVAGLIDRLDSLSTALIALPERRAIYETLLYALAARKQVRLEIQDEVGDETILTTRLSPYRLRRHGTCWQIEGRSTFHRRVRSFPLVRVIRAELTDDGFTIPPHYSQSSQAKPARTRPRVRLRCRESMVTVVQELFPYGLVRSPVQDNGWIEVDLLAADLDVLRHWLMGHGERVEVLEPSDLRELLVSSARRIIQNHLPVSILSCQEVERAGSAS